MIYWLIYVIINVSKLLVAYLYLLYNNNKYSSMNFLFKKMN